MAAKAGENRFRSYKTKGLDVEEVRRRKEEEGVELRKSRREEQLLKRRNITESVSSPFEQESLVFFPPDTPLDLLARGLHSPDTQQQIEALQMIRKILCVEVDPPISEVIESGTLPKLVQLLEMDYSPVIQLESAWVLTNVASGSHYHTRCVIEHGAVAPLIRLLSSPHSSVREQAVWALGNISGDGPECRDIVLGLGAIDPLIKMLLDDDITLSLKRNATWTLSNLCRGKNPQPDEQVVFKSLVVLAKHLYSDDVNVLSDCAWALSYLSEGSDKRIERVINSGVVKRLVELLMHPDLTVITPALRAIGNILTGDDPLTQVVINCSALPALQHLLGCPAEHIRKETCWAISNVTAGNKVQIQAVIECNIFPILLDIMDSAQYKIRKEAAWAVLNTCAGGTPEHIRYLVNIGVLRPLCDLLTVQDPRVVLITLEGMECILKAGIGKRSINGGNLYALLVEEADGVMKIESLLNHPRHEIYSVAQKILDKYFITEHPDSTVTLLETNNMYNGKF